MNDSLKLRIEHLRAALERRDDGVTFGEFRAGRKAPSREALNPLHAAFLDLSDGGRFGAVDLWSTDELEENQFRAQAKPGGADSWLEIGQIVYEPIFLRRSDSTVHLPQFRGGAAHTTMNFDTFLEDYVFGNKYAQLYDGAGEERWHTFLSSVRG